MLQGVKDFEAVMSLRDATDLSLGSLASVVPSCKFETALVYVQRDRLDVCVFCIDLHTVFSYSRLCECFYFATRLAPCLSNSVQ